MQGIGITANSDQEFLIEIVKQINESMLKHPLVGKAPDVPKAKIFDNNSFDAFSKFMSSLTHLITLPGMVLLMFDEFEVLDKKVTDGHFSVGIFGLLRHQMQYN